MAEKKRKPRSQRLSPKEVKLQFLGVVDVHMHFEPTSFDEGERKYSAEPYVVSYGPGETEGQDEIRAIYHFRFKRTLEGEPDFTFEATYFCVCDIPRAVTEKVMRELTEQIGKQSVWPTCVSLFRNVVSSSAFDVNPPPLSFDSFTWDIPNDWGESASEGEPEKVEKKVGKR